MTISRVLPAVVATLVWAIAPSHAAAQSEGRNRVQVPPVPAEIQVPLGYSVYLQGYAVGTQNYLCAVTKAGTLDWTFIGPQATLFLTANGEPVMQRLTHFLSENPLEFERFRPTWQHSVDSSRAWGAVAATSEDPAYVAPGAIPWLLLDVVGEEAGPTGGKTVAQAALIHRLNTSGGRKPTSGCTMTEQIGKMAFVPYTADYYFYRTR